MSNDDIDDLFSDDAMANARQKRNNRRTRLVDGTLTDADREALARAWKTARPKSTRKKPEKINQDRIWDHIVDVYGAKPSRVNSGHWRTDDGYIVAGAKAGTADIIAELCVIINEEIRMGIFFAIETKSMQGTATDAQLRYLQAVRDRGGIACVARTILDVDTAIAEWCSRMTQQLGVPVRAARKQPKP